MTTLPIQLPETLSLAETEILVEDSDHNPCPTRLGAYLQTMSAAGFEADEILEVVSDLLISGVHEPLVGVQIKLVAWGETPTPPGR